MAKFLEVHHNKIPFLVNIDHILQVIGPECVNRELNGSILIAESSRANIDESYDEIKQMIGNAQGGIPMEHRGEHDEIFS